MTSCYEMEDEEEGDEDKLEKSSKNEERALTILEASPACMANPQLVRRSMLAYCCYLAAPKALC